MAVSWCSYETLMAHLVACHWSLGESEGLGQDVLALVRAY